VATVTHPVLLRIFSCDICCRANRIGAKRVQKFLEKKQVSRTPKFILEACADPERNPHNLKPSTVSGRFYRMGETLEKALSYPAHSKTSAAKLARKKTFWGQWNPGQFSKADKERRA